MKKIVETCPTCGRILDKFSNFRNGANCFICHHCKKEFWEDTNEIAFRPFNPKREYDVDGTKIKLNHED